MRELELVPDVAVADLALWGLLSASFDVGVENLRHFLGVMFAVGNFIGLNYALLLNL